jgi:hypothetical protein
MNLIMRSAKRIYGLPEPKLEGYWDLIAVHCYAGQRRNGQVWLPPTEKTCLLEGCHLYSSGHAEKLGWANTLGYDISPEEMDAAKLRVINSDPTYRTSVHAELQALPATNTVTEIEVIIKAFRGLRRVIAIGHWMHMRRTAYLWNKLFDGEVAVVSVDGRWTGIGHPSPYCHTDERFLIMNMAADAMTRVRGVDYMRTRTHVTIPSATANKAA